MATGATGMVMVQTTLQVGMKPVVVRVALVKWVPTMGRMKGWTARSRSQNQVASPMSLMATRTTPTMGSSVITQLVVPMAGARVTLVSSVPCPTIAFRPLTAPPAGRHSVSAGVCWWTFQ